MSQFQPEVPHPLIDDVPCLLPGGRTRAPEVGALISKSLCEKGAVGIALKPSLAYTGSQYEHGVWKGGKRCP